MEDKHYRERDATIFIEREKNIQKCLLVYVAEI